LIKAPASAGAFLFPMDEISRLSFASRAALENHLDVVELDVSFWTYSDFDLNLIAWSGHHQTGYEIFACCSMAKLMNRGRKAT
jgi:hypothetical protein